MNDKKINRRQFIKSSSALIGAAAIPMFIPARALGRDGHTAPSDRIIMASIGLGGQGRVDLRNLIHKDGVQFVAVCDVDRANLMRGKSIVDATNDNEDCILYSDFRELLQRTDLDAVHIATPDHWHATAAIAAAKAGLGIYSQKPLTRTIREGRALCNTVKQYNVIFQTGTQQRSDERFRLACELVQNGRVGKVYKVDVGIPAGKAAMEPYPIVPVPDGLDWDFWLGPAPKVPFRKIAHYSWRYIQDYGFGGLTDWGVHHIDIAQWGLGEDRSGPVEVEGVGAIPKEGMFNVPIDFNLNYKYKNGVHLNVANRGNKGGATWYGDKGWVNVSRGQISAEPASILQEWISPNEIHLYDSKDHYQNFVDCIRSRKETITPCEVGHRSTSVPNLGEIAIMTGRKLTWDPDKEIFPNDPEANRLLSRPMRTPWTI
jgi:predicted dehydrogenase